MNSSVKENVKSEKKKSSHKTTGKLGYYEKTNPVNNIQKGRRKIPGHGMQNVVNKIMEEKFPSPKTEIPLKVQKAYGKSNIQNQERNSP